MQDWRKGLVELEVSEEQQDLLDECCLMVQKWISENNAGLLPFLSRTKAGMRNMIEFMVHHSGSGLSNYVKIPMAGMIELITSHLEEYSHSDDRKPIFE